MLMVEHLDSRRKHENYFYLIFGMLRELVGKETPSMLPLDTVVVVPEISSLSTLP